MPEPDPDPHDTAAELRLVLGRLVRRLRSSDDGLPLRHLAVLGRLDRTGPRTTSELADADRVRGQSMARTVADLTALGRVIAQPHPTDGRKTLIVLTDTGRTALEAERGRRVDWLAEAMEAELSAAEQRTLAAAVPLLSRLADVSRPDPPDSPARPGTPPAAR